MAFIFEASVLICFCAFDCTGAMAWTPVAICSLEIIRLNSGGNGFPLG